jgi:hypothetical protein
MYVCMHEEVLILHCYLLISMNSEHIFLRSYMGFVIKLLTESNFINVWLLKQPPIYDSINHILLNKFHMNVVKQCDNLIPYILLQ